MPVRAARFPIIFIAIVLYLTCIKGGEFEVDSEIGTVARVDLLNAMKIALNLAKPHATKKEHRAATQFAKFLATPSSEEYLEAFYSSHSVHNTNSFISFLNAFLYNGDPFHPAWQAAEILANMIISRTNSTLIELIRKKIRQNALNRAEITILPNTPNNFTKLLKGPFQLTAVIDNKSLRIKEVFKTRSLNFENFSRIPDIVAVVKYYFPHNILRE